MLIIFSSFLTTWHGSDEDLDHVLEICGTKRQTLRRTLLLYIDWFNYYSKDSNSSYVFLNLNIGYYLSG